MPLMRRPFERHDVLIKTEEHVNVVLEYGTSVSAHLEVK